MPSALGPPGAMGWLDALGAPGVVSSWADQNTSDVPRSNWDTFTRRCVPSVRIDKLLFGVRLPVCDKGSQLPKPSPQHTFPRGARNQFQQTPPKGSVELILADPIRRGAWD
eukprot:gene10971-biopygen4691